ncbi:hypothetical protein, partial [Streptomyces sp. NPDC088246]|uniref:hypothetical protein n=1 Tax=Streptomyces sp. NPDC088246 TaxID=3365842 RepID=UPI00382C234A
MPFGVGHAVPAQRVVTALPGERGLPDESARWTGPGHAAGKFISVSGTDVGCAEPPAGSTVTALPGERGLPDESARWTGPGHAAGKFISVSG